MVRSRRGDGAVAALVVFRPLREGAAARVVRCWVRALALVVCGCWMGGC